MKKQIANIITFCRILGSIGLLFCPAFSGCFYGLYLFCGLTDMVDGTIARKTGSVSIFGARLDTVADFLFTIVTFAKILPGLFLPVWIWVWIAVIAVVKLANFIRSILLRKPILSLHTVANKATGLCLFLLPLIIPLWDLQYITPVICAGAMFAAIQEGYYLTANHDVV